jgi:hypothetical protein
VFMNPYDFHLNDVHFLSETSRDKLNLLRPMDGCVH